MSQHFFKKYSKNPLEKEDKEALNHLVEKGKERLSELQEIDQEIIAIQGSTKTTSPSLPLSITIAALNTNGTYNWHAKPYATKVHVGVLTLILLSSLAIGSYPLLGKPHTARATTTTCTWNNGAGTASWNTATNWSCGNVPNNTNDVVLDATSNTAITIDVATPVLTLLSMQVTPKLSPPTRISLLIPPKVAPATLL